MDPVLPIYVGSAAEKFSNIIPRFTGPQEFDPDSVDYWVNISCVSFTLLLLVLIVYAIWLSYLLCRCFVNCVARCCGCAKGVDDSEKKTTVKFTLLTLILGATVCAVFAALSYEANHKFSDALQGDDGATTNARVIFSATIVFAQGLVGNANYVFVAATTVAEEAISTAAELLAVGHTVTSTVGEFGSFADSLEDLEVEAPSGEIFECDCDDIANVANNAFQTTSEAAAEATTAIEDAARYVDENVVPTAQEAVDSIDSTLEDARGLTDDLEEYDSDLDKILAQLEDIDYYRTKLVDAFMVLPLVSLVLILIGCICSAALLFKFNTAVTLLTIVTVFANFGVHLMITAIVSDSCMQLTKSEKNLQDVAPEEVYTVVMSCLGELDLMDHYGVTPLIEDLEQIQADEEFPDGNDIPIIQLADLGLVIANVSDLSPADFGFEEFSITDPLDEINNITLSEAAVFYTVENITMLDVNDYEDEDLPDLLDTLNEALIEQATILGVIDGLNGDIEEIGANFEDINTDQRQIVVVALGTLTSLLTPLLDSLTNLVDNTDCRFAVVDYTALKSSVCQDLVLSGRSLLMWHFLLGLISIPCLIASIMTATRYDNKKSFPRAIDSAQVPLHSGSDDSDKGDKQIQYVPATST